MSSSTFLAIDPLLIALRRFFVLHSTCHDTPVVTVIDKCGQATKGVWWMPWHREATKDVVACDKLREAGKRASIRRFLNVETQMHDLHLPSVECIDGQELTWGTETSKYPEEKKETSIP